MSTTVAEKALRFACYNCKTENWAADTLEYDPIRINGTRFMYQDKIDCVVCGAENHVVL